MFVLNRAQLDAVFETDEFTLDASVAPGGVLVCRALNEAPDVADRRAGGLVWVCPCFRDQVTVASQQSARCQGTVQA
jgi:hypothetical protein